MTPSGAADALSRARFEVDAHRDRRLGQGADATEEELTTTLLMNAFPELRYQEFNRAEEARLGADWLWWFVSDCGECFGVLLQAKKLKRTSGKWSVDLGYVVGNGTRRQMDALLATSDAFNVPAGYILYCGDADYRSGLDCGPTHATEPYCERCLRSGVTVLAGPCAKYLLDHGEPGEIVFRISDPLEQMVCPANDKVMDLNLRLIDSDLRALLLEPQDSARAVAKHFFAQASRMRLGHFGGGATELAPVQVGGQVFGTFPIDMGHFGVNYYEHCFRGLRLAIPPEVAELAAGRTLDPEDFPGLAGVVVVQMLEGAVRT